MGNAENIHPYPLDRHNPNKQSDFMIYRKYQPEFTDPERRIEEDTFDRTYAEVHSYFPPLDVAIRMQLIDQMGSDDIQTAQEAARVLFLSLLPKVAGMVLYYDREHIDKSDVYQEASLKLLKWLPTYNPAKGDFDKFTSRGIKTIIRTVKGKLAGRQYWRAEDGSPRYPLSTEMMEETGQLGKCSGETPEQSVLRDETRREQVAVFNEVYGMLSEEEQAVISLRHGLNSDELSLHEIAEVLSLPISNIRSRYYRALNKLDKRAAKKLGYV